LFAGFAAAGPQKQKGRSKRAASVCLKYDYPNLCHTIEPARLTANTTTHAGAIPDACSVDL
jgi:hypothetical protein